MLSLLAELWRPKFFAVVLAFDSLVLCDARELHFKGVDESCRTLSERLTNLKDIPARFYEQVTRYTYINMIISI